MIECRGYDNNKSNPFYFYDETDSFDYVEKLFQDKYSIPQKIIKDTIIRELASSSRLKIDFFKYYSFIALLFVSILLSRKKKYMGGEILLDNFTENAYERFYQYIKNEHKEKQFAYLSKEKSAHYPINTDFIKISKFYERKIAFKIFINEFFSYYKYKKLSKIYGVDYVTLVVKLLHWTARYTSDVENIKYKLLISSGDNNYNAIRYYIYKKNAIKNIFLFQNGTRGAGLHNISKDYCVYCDYYFAFGTQSISFQSGMVAKKKIPFGSISLMPYANNLKTSPQYDIVFLEQMTPHHDKEYEGKNLKNATYENYMLMIDNLVKFSNDFPALKILYRITTLGKRNFYPKIVEDINLKLYGSNVIFDIDIHKNSYEAIINARLCILYSSSVGFEALGLGKKVLFLNYNNLDFVFSRTEETGVLTDNSYMLFKEKLINLLKDDKKTDKYYADKRKFFMNIHGYSPRFLNKIIQKCVTEH